MTRTTAAAERRADILAATLRVIAREGLAETTTRKIAAEAGVNQATLRYYFGSKDDLLFAVLQEMMRMTGEVVQAGISASNELSEAIAESIRAFWLHVEEAPELQVMQYELTLYALRHPESAWLAKQQYDGYSALVETLLEQNFAAAGKPCAISFAELARFIIAGLDGLILQFISGGRDTIQAQRDLDHLIHAVIALAEGEPSA
ncbi:MAG: TetR/AcrR family transcriptional regulator [Ktedonobacteraceae bacterium]